MLWFGLQPADSNLSAVFASLNFPLGRRLHEALIRFFWNNGSPWCNQSRLAFEIQHHLKKFFESCLQALNENKFRLCSRGNLNPLSSWGCRICHLWANDASTGTSHRAGVEPGKLHGSNFSKSFAKRNSFKTHSYYKCNYITYFSHHIILYLLYCLHIEAFKKQTCDSRLASAVPGEWWTLQRRHLPHWKFKFGLSDEEMCLGQTGSQNCNLFVDVCIPSSLPWLGSQIGKQMVRGARLFLQESSLFDSGSVRDTLLFRHMSVLMPRLPLVPIGFLLDAYTKMISHKKIQRPERLTKSLERFQQVLQMLKRWLRLRAMPTSCEGTRYFWWRSWIIDSLTFVVQTNV